MKITAPLIAAAGTLLLAACATTAPASDPASPPDDAHHDTTDAPARLVLLVGNTLQVLDAATLEKAAEIPVTDVSRITEAGDGRHILLMGDSSARVLDAGVWKEDHGDHQDARVQMPATTAQKLDIDRPTHAVAHDGRLAIFGDGDGSITTLDLTAFADTPLVAERVTAGVAHHGVAVPLADGTLLASQGNGDGLPDMVRVLDAAGGELARTEACRDLHGETVAGADAVLFGCAGAVLVHDADGFRAIALPAPDARVGGPKGSPASDVVVADYGVSGGERTQLALVDVASDTITLVDTPAGYTAATLARTSDGGAVILGLDGQLLTLDVTTGQITDSVRAIDPWTPPTGHGAAPAVQVIGETAFVSNPETGTLAVIDLASGALLDTRQFAGLRGVAVATGDSR